MQMGSLFLYVMLLMNTNNVHQHNQVVMTPLAHKQQTENSRTYIVNSYWVRHEEVVSK